MSSSPQPSASAATFSAARHRYGEYQWQRGVERMKERRFEDARRLFDRAVRAAPLDPVYWVNLATACRRSDDLEGTFRAAARANELDPDMGPAWLLRAEALSSMHRCADAIAAYQQAERCGHVEPETLVQHASMLQALGHQVACIDKLLKATTLRPEYAVAHGLMAMAFRELGRATEAVECLKTLQALAPGNLQAHALLSYEKRHLFEWADLDADVAEITRLIEQASPAAVHQATSFSLLSLPLDPMVQRTAAVLDARVGCRGIKPLPPLDPRSRTGQPLRVGYLSGDLRQHPVGQLLIEVLEQRRRESVEVTLYTYSGDDRSDLLKRFQDTADRYVDINHVSNTVAAERIRADGIDVLVDLQGHTRGQRLGIAAQRPAPVQVSYLGFAGTTGADCIDYLIGDPFVTPVVLEDLYAEKLAQLPQCFQPNGRWRPLPQPMSREAADLPEEAFVMCAFNNTYKILPEAFDAWCAVMREVPHAVLWLKESNSQLHPNVWREAERRGVDRNRIVFARNVAFADHFSRLALADVFVDTWPYNAHTTASDALWAGVPVVTVYGNSYQSRVAASVLNAVGLPDLAFGNVDDYVLAIRTLADDRPLLQSLRQHLEGVRMTAPLFDARARADELEALYRRMADRSRRGLAPEHQLAD